MTHPPTLAADQIRAALAENTTLRPRDLADKLGISEAQLVAAQVGQGVTWINPAPDALFPMLAGLGEVMALTRNDSCVIEKIGVYDNFHSGVHASMVLNDAIDLRMFPSHWVTGFAVEKETDTGIRRSLQIFDAAGDAVHKIHLRDGSDLEHWAVLVAGLALQDQPDTVQVTPRVPPEAPKADIARLDVLRKEWARMTDTHQFLRLTSKLKMNRLGAYRIVGEPMARPLPVEAVDTMFETVAESGVEIMCFVGNRGCIEIHGGPIQRLKAMGPWQNVLDPDFNLHLRMDHIAEVWAVTKPTQRGDAVSVEAFDANGTLIFQMFGRRSGEQDHRAVWNDIVAGLPSAQVREAV